MEIKKISILCGVILFFCTILLPIGNAKIVRLIFITTDEHANAKFEFQLDENVYITGGNFEGFHEVTIYVLPNREAIKPGNAVSNGVNATTTIVLGYTTLETTLIWESPLMPGEYDIWIDVNQNGEFDYPDKYRRFCCSPMLTVIPEIYIGAIGTLLAMFVAFTTYFAKIKR